MSEQYYDEEYIKELADIKRYIERRISELENEIRLLKACMKIIDEKLSKISFRPAIEMVKEKEEVRRKERIEIRHRQTGRLLAIAEKTPNKLKIIIVRGIRVPVARGIFQSFFIRKILEKMKEEDENAVYEGKLAPTEVLKYDIVDENGYLKEIIIYNYRSKDRLKEIISSIRWTLERIQEK